MVIGRKSVSNPLLSHKHKAYRITEGVGFIKPCGKECHSPMVERLTYPGCFYFGMFKKVCDKGKRFFPAETPRIGKGHKLSEHVAMHKLFLR